MKKRYFHVSAKLIADGVYFYIEKLFCIGEFHSDKQCFPLADIREYIVEGVKEETNKKYKRTTFLLNHIEEIDRDNYDEIISVFKGYDDAELSKP